MENKEGGKYIGNFATLYLYLRCGPKAPFLSRCWRPENEIQRIDIREEFDIKSNSELYLLMHTKNFAEESRTMAGLFIKCVQDDFSLFFGYWVFGIQILHGEMIVA